MDGYKVLTHDFRPPLQGGPPVWDGKRKTLDKVRLDTGPDECGAGWNFCRAPETALRIAGLWPDGRPSVLLRVRGSQDTVERGDKLRCSRLTILDVCSEAEVAVAVGALSEPFGEHAVRMAASQMDWRTALGRPEHDELAVEAGLRAALKIRGLGWTLQRYDGAGAAWDAWDARDAGEAWDARDAWDARVAWVAWDARVAWVAWDARDAWAARAAWAAWAARAAGEAWAALTVEYAALEGWTSHDPLLLTTGLRDAYRHGLAVAVPTGPNTLEWAMERPS